MWSLLISQKHLIVFYLLIAKLHAFGFDLKPLKVIHAYLNDRIQVTKVVSFYIKILKIIYGVQQV